VLPTYVALVPQDRNLLETAELLNVAAALQTQATRDLGPLWAVAGVVSPFSALQDVPPGYIPLVIVDNDVLPAPWHGYHFTVNGQPVGLVECRDDWSVLASHELMEILCDPWGTRTVPGSLRDDSQAQVEYLVEVCDPCQHMKYTINGVQVSDFVTPQYYDPSDTERGRYSFTGRIERPLQLLPAAYITWRTPDGNIRQEFADETGKVTPRGALSFSREWVNSYPPNEIARKVLGKPPLPRPYVLDDSAREYGRALERDIKRILNSLSPGAPPTSRVAILELLHELATDPSFYEKFEAMADEDRRKELQKRDIDTSNLPDPLTPLPSMDDFKKVLDALNAGQGFGPAFDEPGTGKGLLSLGSLGGN
jgi:hypothetical protein